MSSTMTFALGSAAGIGALLTLLQSRSGRKVVSRLMGALGGEPLPEGAPPEVVPAPEPAAGAVTRVHGSTTDPRVLDAPIGSFELPPGIAAISSVGLSTDGLLVVGTAKGQVLVFDVGKLRAPVG